MRLSVNSYKRTDGFLLSMTPYEENGFEKETDFECSCTVLLWSDRFRREQRATFYSATTDTVEPHECEGSRLFFGIFSQENLFLLEQSS